MSTPPPLSFDRYQRWRLILGKQVEQELQGACGMGGGGAGGAEGQKPAGGKGQGGKGRGGGLSREMIEIDEALTGFYDEAGSEASSKKRSAGLGAGSGKVATWLGDIRKYFETDVVVMIQQDAIERKGMKQLLFEPELLGQVTPSVEMVGTLLALKSMIPDLAKQTARDLVRAVVEEIKKRLLANLERAVRGALNRSQHQPIPSLPNLDWRRTIRKNLHNYLPDRKLIVPDRFFFYARQQRRKEWNVIVCMDQSGSMAESVVYGGVMAAIFASLPALDAHVVAFDTEVVDLSQHLSDPVDLLFGVQLGGGTDINRAVAYCQGLIKDPRKTMFILLTDLYEGGVRNELLKRLDAMHQDGVRAMVMLALSDSGVPSYDEALAKDIRNLGVPAFACTPKLLPDVVEATLKGHPLDPIVARVDKGKKR